MSKTTGPILAAGLITMGNAVLLSHQDPAQIVPVAVATTIAAFLLAGAEKIDQPIAVGIAYIALITTVLMPRQGGGSVAQNLLNITKLG